MLRRLYHGQKVVVWSQVRLLLLCVLTIILFLNLSFSFTKIREEQQRFHLEQKSEDDLEQGLDLTNIIIRTVKPITILLWNPMFVGIPGDMLTGKQSFTACKHLPCSLTVDRSYESSADAIIMPWFERAMFTKVPERSNPNQIIVFETLEGPMINAKPNDNIYDAYRGIYNWTMTYRNDADVKKSYGEFHYYDIGERPSLRGIRNMLPNKTKMAAWFVSNIIGAQDRYRYIRELQKYMSIDVYGPNQKLKCPTSAWGECLEMVDVNYKFYMSFENTISMDYITEKMFSHIGRPVVPVVFGGANYKRIFPPHSYVDSAYFKTAKELAQYLLHLSVNPHLYMEYFDWIQRGIFQFHQPQWCNLCLKLLTRRENEVKYYKDIYDWYYDENFWIKKLVNRPSRFEIDKAFNYN